MKSIQAYMNMTLVNICHLKKNFQKVVKIIYITFIFQFIVILMIYLY